MHSMTAYEGHTCISFTSFFHTALFQLVPTSSTSSPVASSSVSLAVLPMSMRLAGLLLLLSAAAAAFVSNASISRHSRGASIL